jgi:hypothetical protein
VKSRLALLVAATLVLSGCGYLRMPQVWPFYKKPKPIPGAVQELDLVNADGSSAGYKQYWQRNTLVIDLTAVSGEGSVTARLPEGTEWPVRMALNVRPGSVGQLEIQAEERNVMPVTAEGAKPVNIELAPSVYTPKTSAIYIAWGPVPVFVDTAAPEAEPAFVSPTEVPRPAGDVTGDAAPSASDIVSPADAAQPQASPPGS